MKKANLFYYPSQKIALLLVLIAFLLSILFFWLDDDPIPAFSAYFFYELIMFILLYTGLLSFLLLSLYILIILIFNAVLYLKKRFSFLK